MSAAAVPCQWHGRCTKLATVRRELVKGNYYDLCAEHATKDAQQLGLRLDVLRHTDRPL